MTRHPRSRRGILVLNAGSSSLKFAIYESGAHGEPELAARGEIEGIDEEPHFTAKDAAGAALEDRRWKESTGIHDLLDELMRWIESRYGADHLAAAGHRVALGGLAHSEPALLSADTLEQLQALVPLAPLHQPRNLEPIEALWNRNPELSQVACFDTGFHRSMPRVAELYGLPRALAEAGARRYGFHGLSYEYIAGELPRIDPAAAQGRTIVAHLGSGASMCALSAGRSVATTMGFSPLSGLIMGTRPGELDLGLLLWLIRERGMSPAEIERVLYHESGLLGVSGLSSDMRELLASKDPRAREAVELFVYRVCRELGSLAAALGGLDALVFTGGIGEHAAPVRAAICRQSAWLGISLNEEVNDRGGSLLSTAGSPATVRIVPTDEELMIARHTSRIAFVATSKSSAKQIG